MPHHLLRRSEIPPHARGPLDRLLAELDRAAADAIVWLEGSIVLGDYRPGISDIDVVIVTDQRIPALERRPLQITWLPHRALPSLASTPLGAVTAATLHRHGISLRGPQPSTLVADVSHTTLARAMVDNVRAYWQPWLERTRSHPVARAVALHPRRIAWGIFGVPRMLVTLRDGRIVSKTEGALELRARVDAPWRRIIDEALRLRLRLRGALYWNPFARRRDMFGLVERAIALAV